jgi:hypothetical protein
VAEPDDGAIKIIGETPQTDFYRGADCRGVAITFCYNGLILQRA